MIRSTAKTSHVTARPVALALAGALAAGAVGLYAIGSDQWIVDSYAARSRPMTVWAAMTPRAGTSSTGPLKSVVADEAFWLKAGASDVTPAVVHVPQKLSFGALDVLDVTPLPTGLGLPGDGLQPMVLVTARETIASGSRLIRFIVDANSAPVVTAPVTKGL